MLLKNVPTLHPLWWSSSHKQKIIAHEFLLKHFACIIVYSILWSETRGERSRVTQIQLETLTLWDSSTNKRLKNTSNKNTTKCSMDKGVSHVRSNNQILWWTRVTEKSLFLHWFEIVEILRWFMETEYFFFQLEIGWVVHILLEFHSIS